MLTVVELVERSASWRAGWLGRLGPLALAVVEELGPGLLEPGDLALRAASPRGRDPRAARRAWRRRRPRPGRSSGPATAAGGRCRRRPPRRRRARPACAGATSSWPASRRAGRRARSRSAARSTVSSSMIPSRTGWASAASSRGSLSRRYDGPCCRLSCPAAVERRLARRLDCPLRRVVTARPPSWSTCVESSLSKDFLQ